MYCTDIRTWECRLRKHVLAIVSTIRSGKITDDESKDHVITSLVLPIASELSSELMCAGHC